MLPLSEVKRAALEIDHCYVTHEKETLYEDIERLSLISKEYESVRHSIGHNELRNLALKSSRVAKKILEDIINSDSELQYPIENLKDIFDTLDELIARSGIYMEHKKYFADCKDVKTKLTDCDIAEETSRSLSTAMEKEISLIDGRIRTIELKLK